MLCGPDGLWSWCLPDKVELTPHRRKGNFDVVWVHVAYEDVEAYAKWIGKELPTEAEWEFAARGGLHGAEFVWGHEFTPGGKHLANTWQGEFPRQNLKVDGIEGTAPVGSFPPNGYGLYDMAGNVWEWTTDWYQEHSKIEHSCCASFNPQGGEQEKSYDPKIPNIPTVPKKCRGRPRYFSRKRIVIRSKKTRNVREMP